MHKNETFFVMRLKAFVMNIFLVSKA
jgi:hypothetical protein